MDMAGQCSSPCRPMDPCDMGGVSQPCVPYCCPPGTYSKYPTPIKKSMSFLTTSELFSYKAIPAAAVFTYLAPSVGTIANEETFVK